MNILLALTGLALLVVWGLLLWRFYLMWADEYRNESYQQRAARLDKYRVVERGQIAVLVAFALGIATIVVLLCSRE